MLVLTRKQNERIVVGNGLLTLTIVEIRRDTVRLGFEASSKDLPIWREEIQRVRDQEGQS